MLEVSDIKGRTFDVQKNGYNPVEVDAFRSDVASQYKELLSKNEELENKLAVYEEDSSAISEALIIAQRESNKILSDARNKAKKMVEDAKSEQVRLAEQSQAECERIVNEHKEKCAQLIKENTEETENKIKQIKDSYEELKKSYVSLRQEVTYFKSGLIDLYNEQLKLLMDMPVLSDEEMEQIDKGEEIADKSLDNIPSEEYPEEVSENSEENTEEKSEEAISDPEKVDEILHTGSDEPVLPKNSSEDLKFGKNN